MSIYIVLLVALNSESNSKKRAKVATNQKRNIHKRAGATFYEFTCNLHKTLRGAEPPRGARPPDGQHTGASVLSVFLDRYKTSAIKLVTS